METPLPRHNITIEAVVSGVPVTSRTTGRQAIPIRITNIDYGARDCEGGYSEVTELQYAGSIPASRGDNLRIYVKTTHRNRIISFPHILSDPESVEIIGDNGQLKSRYDS